MTPFFLRSQNFIVSGVACFVPGGMEGYDPSLASLLFPPSLAAAVRTDERTAPFIQTQIEVITGKFYDHIMRGSSAPQHRPGERAQLPKSCGGKTICLTKKERGKGRKRNVRHFHLLLSSCFLILFAIPIPIGGRKREWENTYRTWDYRHMTVDIVSIFIGHKRSLFRLKNMFKH